jgi:predicted DNA-binding transcriptional regulator YafY
MARGDQVSRQWRILRLLERRPGGWTVRELHAELGEEVTERTIFRDIDDLQAAGFQLRDDSGRWCLSEGASVRGVPILPTELLSLLLANDLLEGFRPSEIAEGLASLREKLSATLSPRGRQYVELRKQNACATFMVPGVLADPEPVEAIEEAIRLEHRIAILYRSPAKEPTRRIVDPYCLWFADGRLYLIGWCHLRKDVRTFHVSRIREAEVIDEAFDIDPSFDAKRFIGAGFGVWSGEQHDVELDFEPDVAHVPSERRLHETQACRDLGNGGVRVTLRAGGLPQLATWLAGFGGLVRVVKPDVLRDMVLAIHQSAIEAYGAVGERIGEKAS